MYFFHLSQEVSLLGAKRKKWIAYFRDYLALGDFRREGRIQYLGLLKKNASLELLLAVRQIINIQLP